MASQPSTRRNSVNAGDSTSTSDETLPAHNEESKIGTSDRTKDFGFLPIPARLRYNPEKPAHFGLLLNVCFPLRDAGPKIMSCQVVFGFASTLTGLVYVLFGSCILLIRLHSVANLYYCQPLLSITKLWLSVWERNSYDAA